MVKQVTSVRIEEELLNKAQLHRINLSHLFESALESELNRLDARIMQGTGFMPVNFPGLRENARILSLDEKKFKSIKKIKIGEAILSYNHINRTVEKSRVLSIEPIYDTPKMTRNITIKHYDISLDVLPATKLYCWKRSSSRAKWIKAEDIQPGIDTFLNSPISQPGTHPLGTSGITEVYSDFIEDIFYYFEAYPYNSCFANSIHPTIKKLYRNYPESVWGFPIFGYPNLFIS